jgi:hypothetical protein
MAMQPYQRLAGDTGVTAFLIHPRSIEIEFVDGSIYTYTYASAGKTHVDNMKLLAEAGQGLSTYISQFVRDNYSARR